jgi:hypothetical protein
MSTEVVLICSLVILQSPQLFGGCMRFMTTTGRSVAGPSPVDKVPSEKKEEKKPVRTSPESMTTAFQKEEEWEDRTSKQGLR